MLLKTMKYNQFLFPSISLGFLVWGCFFANPLLAPGQQQPDNTDDGPHYTVALPNFVRPHELELKSKQAPELSSKKLQQRPQITVWIVNDKNHPNLRYKITDEAGNTGMTIDPSLEDGLTSKYLSKVIFDFTTDITVVPVGGEVAIYGNDVSNPNHCHSVSFITHCRHPNNGDALDVDWYP
jgi:hypothetical protein